MSLNPNDPFFVFTRQWIDDGCEVRRQILNMRDGESYHDGVVLYNRTLPWCERGVATYTGDDGRIYVCIYHVDHRTYGDPVIEERARFTPSDWGFYSLREALS